MVRNKETGREFFDVQMPFYWVIHSSCLHNVTVRMEPLDFFQYLSTSVTAHDQNGGVQGVPGFYALLMSVHF